MFAGTSSREQHRCNDLPAQEVAGPLNAKGAEAALEALFVTILVLLPDPLPFGLATSIGIT